MGDLTDKTMVVVSRLGDYWVNPTRARKVMKAKQDDPNGCIELDGSLIGCHAIEGVVTAEQYVVVNYRRRGAWQCKYKWWHERNQQCAHQTYNPKEM